MILVNNTKGKVRIKKDAVKGDLLQEDIILPKGGKSKPLTREQINAINPYIVAFKLTVKDGKKERTFVAPTLQETKKKSTIIPGQEIVEDPEEEPEAAGFESSYTEADLEEKTVAELRSLCRQHTLLVSGNRETLLKRLLQGNARE